MVAAPWEMRCVMMMQISLAIHWNCQPNISHSFYDYCSSLRLFFLTAHKKQPSSHCYHVNLCVYISMCSSLPFSALQSNPTPKIIILRIESVKKENRTIRHGDVMSKMPFLIVLLSYDSSYLFLAAVSAERSGKELRGAWR